MKNKFPIKQFVLPVCVTVVLIFCIGAVTVIYIDISNNYFENQL